MIYGAEVVFPPVLVRVAACFVCLVYCVVAVYFGFSVVFVFSMLCFPYVG